MSAALEAALLVVFATATASTLTPSLRLAGANPVDALRSEDARGSLG